MTCLTASCSLIQIEIIRFLLKEKNSISEGLEIQCNILFGEAHRCDDDRITKVTAKISPPKTKLPYV